MQRKAVAAMIKDAADLTRLFISVCRCCVDSKRSRIRSVKRYWEIIADNLSKAGWSWGCVSAIDSNGRTVWIAVAHRGDGTCFVVGADQKLTAYLELESQTRGANGCVSG